MVAGAKGDRRRQIDKAFICYIQYTSKSLSSKIPDHRVTHDTASLEQLVLMTLLMSKTVWTPNYPISEPEP